MSRRPWPPPAAIGSGATTRRVNPKTLITGCASVTATRWQDDFKRLAVAVFQPLFEHGREIPG